MIGVALGTAPLAEAADPVPALSAALEAWTADSTSSEFQFALADLNGDDQNDAVVLLTGSDWCGSGGCTLVTLKGGEFSFSVLGSTTLVHPPIGVLPDKSQGWRTLTVTVGGGGDLKGGVAILPFQEGAYARNPSLTRRATADETATITTLTLKSSQLTP